MNSGLNHELAEFISYHLKPCLSLLPPEYFIMETAYYTINGGFKYQNLSYHSLHCDVLDVNQVPNDLNIW